MRAKRSRARSHGKGTKRGKERIIMRKRIHRAKQYTHAHTHTHTHKPNTARKVHSPKAKRLNGVAAVIKRTLLLFLYVPRDVLASAVTLSLSLSPVFTAINVSRRICMHKNVKVCLCSLTHTHSLCWLIVLSEASEDRYFCMLSHILARPYQFDVNRF